MNALTATLTDKQAAFVKELCKHGDGTLAARVAGYSNPSVDSWKLRQLPTVQAAVAAELRRFLTMTAAPAALDLLYRVMTDEKQPDTKLRIACAKTLADRSGFIAPKAQASNGLDGKSVVDMNRQELIEMSQRIAKELSDRAAPVIDSEPGIPVINSELIDILE